MFFFPDRLVSANISAEDDSLPSAYGNQVIIVSLQKLFLSTSVFVGLFNRLHIKANFMTPARGISEYVLFDVLGWSRWSYRDLQAANNEYSRLAEGVIRPPTKEIEITYNRFHSRRYLNIEAFTINLSGFVRINCSIETFHIIFAVCRYFIVLCSHF
jgi:hypothetical protein